MNRKTLLKDITEEIEKVAPGDGEEELDGEDLESIEEAVERVFEGARECLDEDEDEGDDIPLAADPDPAEADE